MSAPDFLHGADRQAHGLGHRPARPVGGLARRRAERALDQLRDHELWDRRFARLARFVVQQPIDPGFHEAALPAPHAGLGNPGPAHDLRRAAAFGCGEDDLRPPDMLLGAVAVEYDRLQPLAISRPKPNFDILSHPRIMPEDRAYRNFLFRSHH